MEEEADEEEKEEKRRRNDEETLSKTVIMREIKERFVSIKITSLCNVKSLTDQVLHNDTILCKISHFNSSVL